MGLSWQCCQHGSVAFGPLASFWTDHSTPELSWPPGLKCPCGGLLRLWRTSQITERLHPNVVLLSDMADPVALPSPLKTLEDGKGSREVKWRGVSGGARSSLLSRMDLEVEFERVMGPKHCLPVWASLMRTHNTILDLQVT